MSRHWINPRRPFTRHIIPVQAIVPFIPFLLIHSAAISDIRVRAEELIYDQYGKDKIIEYQKYVVPSGGKELIEKNSGMRYMFPHVYIWWISESDSLIGLAILDNVKGKSLPITFITFFDHTGNITGSHIVKYREDYGWEVGNRRWLDQFLGLHHGSVYAVGKNIDGISGATISVNSVTRGMKRSSLLAELVIKGRYDGSE